MEDTSEALIEPDQTWLLGNRYADYALCLVFAFTFPLVRHIMFKLVYEPSANRILFPNGVVNADKLKKWKESCWKLTIYILFTTLAFLASYREKWFYETKYFWLGCTKFPPCNLYVSQGVLLFYCVQTGFYIQAIHYLIFHEVRRKDWLESLIHHIVTVFLMSYSYYVNFTRIGIMVMLLHDVSDIFLEVAKLTKYAGKDRAAVAAFATFTVVWILSRLIYFPAVIIRSGLVEPLTLIADVYNIEAEPHYSIFNGMLILLFVLHIYWTYFILKICLMPSIEDIRETPTAAPDKVKSAGKSVDSFETAVKSSPVKKFTGKKRD